MKRALTLSVLLLAIACSGEPPEEVHDEHQDEHAEDAGHDESILTIDEHKLEQMGLATAPADQRLAGTTIEVLGDLRPDEDRYAAISTPIEARFIELFASPGDEVRANQPLARLQSPALGSARAAVQSARARLELAEQTLERKEGLGEGRIVPRREIEEARSAVKAARAELQSALAALNALGTGESAAGAESLFLLRTPIAGTVLARSVARGQVVSPEETAFRVGDLSEVWFIGGVFERDVVKLREGAETTVTLAAAPSHSYPGTVTWIGREVDRRSKTVPVRIELQNSDGMLRPGMSATATIAVGTEQEAVVSVPAQAVQRLDDGWVVFVPHDEEGTFEIRQVRRVRDIGDSVIVDGIEAGTIVVTDGAFMLKAEKEKGEGGGDHHGH